jgi:hypothetical protein
MVLRKTALSCPLEPVLPALSLIEVSEVEVSGHLLFKIFA